MHLHFIWIQDFGFLKRKGINLSERFFITFEHKPDGISVLTIDENPDYIPDFFGKPNIAGVSAIIGKNGSGKSSILDYIKSKMVRGRQAEIEQDLFVYSIKRESDELHYVDLPDDMEVELKGNAAGQFQTRPYDNTLVSGESIKLISNFGDADYLFYSFFLDYKNEPDEITGLINLSTTALLTGQRKRFILENESSNPISGIPTAQTPQITFASDLELLKADELAKGMQLLISPEHSTLPFKIPDSLTIKVDGADRLYFGEETPHTDVVFMIEQFDGKNKGVTGLHKVINDILIGLYINFMLTERKYSPGLKVFYKGGVSSDFSVADSVFSFFSMLKHAEPELNGKKVYYSRYENLYNTVPKFIDLLNEMIEKEFIVFEDREPNAIGVKLNGEAFEAFQRLMDLYLKVKGLSPFLEFKWRSLSTGEQSFFSFASRFHHQKYHALGTLSRSLVIMIDEGDAGFHPVWQREFFNNALDFLSRLFNAHTIQLIFTANTPFLSSDLPKDHIVFIQKTEGGDVTIHQKINSQPETFAANIHSLYADSFYMDTVLIGQFAKEKIDQIIKYLNSADNREPNEEFRKVIEKIGEPILKMKLKEMWKKKFGLREELLQLEQRAAEIRAALGANKETGGI